MPAFFLGILSSGLVVDGLYRCLLRDRYRRFERFTSERLGIDGDRVLIGFAVIVIAGSALCFLAGVTIFARFDEDGVELGRPLTVQSTFHTYAHVKAVEHHATVRAPIGNIVQRPHFIIFFDDGASWSTEGPLQDPGPELAGQIANLVARQSGRALVEKP
jgi:hypothetical protein